MTAKSIEFKFGQYVAWEDMNEQTQVARVDVFSSEGHEGMVVCHCWEQHEPTYVSRNFFDHLRVLDIEPMTNEEHIDVICCL